MSLKIAVQMDPLHAINPLTDTTLALMQEAQKRGHAVFTYTPDMLACENGEVFATLFPLQLHKGEAWFTHGEARRVALKEMDVLLVRQDPPFNMEYITATYWLERLPATTRVFNHPRSLRDLPEKLFPLLFPEYTPPTLITSNAEEIRRFHAAHGSIVLKPLYGYGGKAVFVIDEKAANFEALLETLGEMSSEAMVAQKFLPQVKDQDMRVVLINGEVIGAFGRLPAQGEIRANMRVGGTPVKMELSAKQRRICEEVGPKLRERGIMLAGLDLIGDWLTEINITSPTGFRPLEKLYGINPAAVFWDAVENPTQ